MNPDSDRLIELFSQALAYESAKQRAQFVGQCCLTEPALGEQLESLLLAQQQAGEFLEQTPGSAAAKAGSPLVATQKAGDRIGRYKLLEQIGEGGCGVVYMAEQEEPVRRRVALKVIKLGMDTRSVIARFEAERQALAIMDHGNIAKVFDAGATETGRPYFVMELVRGVKITHYCVENNLPTRERLALFIRVCQSIQHAHQKGIIHRDIKPSNILVTVNDGLAVPKVIDFGIAKATSGQRLTDLTVFTEFHQFVGTPAYMSPEQAVMTSLDVDTRSDIYSLGVLLYELLTGKTPFDTNELLKAGLDEMCRTIREIVPVRPSTRLKKAAPGGSAPQLDPRPSALDPDLDWIVMKCLEKDRARRYETANGLARDIQRYLHNEPVVARPPSQLYRFRKLIRRNKLIFAGGATTAAVLVAGVVMSTWQAVRATRAEGAQTRLRQQAQTGENKAQTEAAKSQHVARFLEGMLQSVGPSVAVGRDTKMLREILDKTAQRVGQELADEPLVEAELRNTMGKVYLELGQYDRAEEMHRRALALQRAGLGAQHPAVALTLNWLSAALCDRGKLIEAEAAAAEALGIQRKIFGEDHPDVATSLRTLGLTLYWQGRMAEAEVTLRGAQALLKKMPVKDATAEAATMHALAVALTDQSKLTEAESVMCGALEAYIGSVGEEHPYVARCLVNLGDILWAEAKLAEAEAVQCQALAMWQRLVGQDHPSVAGAMDSLSLTLQSQGKLAEAEAMQRAALAMRRRVLPEDHHNVANSLDNLAGILRSQGRLAEAEDLYRERLRRRRVMLASDNIFLADAIGPLVGTLRLQGKFAEAEPLAREALAIREKKLPEDWKTFHCRSYLGGLLLDQGKYAEAEPLLVAGCQGLKERAESVDRMPPSAQPCLWSAAQDLIRFYERTGRTVEADQWKQKLNSYESGPRASSRATPTNAAPK